jgi:uncharacterized protein (DUF488 family)
VELFTVGHGVAGQHDFACLLAGAGIEAIVDVRTAPGSRRHPHFAKAMMEGWLADAGVAYRWEPRLGGWRKPDLKSRNTGLRNDSFRGYADYMATDIFWQALDDLLADAGCHRTATMCSESLWWRCHRRLIADAAWLSRGVSVLHLGHDGALTPHRLTPGARLSGEGGNIVYEEADGGG